MKKTKKIIAAAAICAAMVTSLMPISSFAAAAVTTYSVTVEQTVESHTYSAYQIFKGTAQADGSLTDVDWGTGVKDTTDIASELTKINADFAGKTTAAEIAAVLNDLSEEELYKFAGLINDSHLDKVTATSAFSGGKQQFTGLEAGYYIIKDTDKTVGAGEAYTKYILLSVPAETSVVPKTAVPTFMKKVKENNHEVDPQLENANSTDYNDVADYNMGDKVPFALYAELPDLSDFGSYKLVFEDQMDDGLTFNDDVTVTVGSKTLEADDFTVEKTPGDGCDFHVVINDIKDIDGLTVKAGDEVRVDFTAVLNTDAVVGLDGNENQARLKFTNNPNVSDGTDGNEDGTPSGEIPWDKVIVFTYALEIDKVDADGGAPLAGATFVLYNEAQDKAATIVNGKFQGWTTPASGTALTTGEDGKITITGLDDGTYYIKETKAPSKYNKLKEPIKIVIDSETVNNQSWDGKQASDALTNLEITVDSGKSTAGNTDSGLVKATVENNKGKSLPSTGSFGTKAFFIIGGSVAVVAAILLITKKRMKDLEK